MPHPPTYYAGIGSRETPLNILRLMEAIAFRLAEQGHILRSGGAPGADQAFERGCDQAGGRKEIYIPWDGFQGRVANARRDSELYGIFAGVNEAALELAGKFHPNWMACSPGARMLHARNCYQVLGLTLDRPVSDVICWTRRGAGGGGTGQAIRLALSQNIPVHDLGNPRVHEEMLKLVGHVP